MKLKLRCCGRKNPIGVSRNELRLHFEVEDSQEIKSYEIQIAASKEALEKGNYNVGQFAGSQKNGYILRPNPRFFSEKTRYFWRVEVSVGEEKIYSDIAYFETGIDRWNAKWISAASEKGTVQNFKREFELDFQAERAILYICGLGYFDAKINGEKLDDCYYKPLVTDYAPRRQADNKIVYKNNSWRTVYDTYDVTEQLKIGQNVLSVDVGNGYYCNRDKLYGEVDFSYGENQLIYELYIVKDGKEIVIQSDEKTLVSETEWKSTLYKGDHVDFTKNTENYHNAVTLDCVMGKPVSPKCLEDRVDKFLYPQKMWKVDGGTVYDFGINHSGGLHFLAESEEGAGIEIRYAEILGEDGRPNYETSAWHGEDYKDGSKIDVYQENSYRLSKGRNEINPMFSWYCYRYAWVKTSGNVEITDLYSCFIHMEAEQNGHVSCSEESLNRLNEMFLQTLYCNMHSGLISDCPHREKRPYTGDTNIIMKAANYNLDMVGYFYKWMDDILDAQTIDGLIPNTAPHLDGGGGYAWGNAICTISKELYCFTGDKDIVRQCYQAVEKWLGYYEAHRDENYIIRSNSHPWMLGDWLAPDTVESDVYYISTVCYYMAVDTMIFLGDVLEESTDNWKNLRSSIAEGINAIFFKPNKLSYGNGVQGEDVLALSVGIVPKEYEAALKEKVRTHYSKETDYHLDTGIVLTPILIQYLTDHGYREQAYRIMTAKTYPSYYNLMENDTTFSEHWSKMWPDYYIGDDKSRLVKGGGDLSHCHPMYGSVASWLYERVAGLDFTMLYAGKILIRPYFTDFLEWAKADKVLPYGKAEISWQNRNGKFELELEIPQSLIGECCIPSVYKTLTCQQTGKVYEISMDGCFHLDVPFGKWSFQTEEEVKNENKKE